MPTHPLHIIILAAAILAAVAFALFRFYRHQCLLRDHAHLMREAVRNRDFTFRLPVRGLFFGERAMQQALNDMSLDIKALEARKEVESWQRLTRVLTHEIMNAATPISSISQAYLSDPQIKGTPYEEGINGFLVVPTPVVGIKIGFLEVPTPVVGIKNVFLEDPTPVVCIKIGFLAS